ncbi:tyrosinase family protein [Blastococcus sp. SYSU DS0533]
MTTIRRDVWSLGTEEQPWHPVLLGHAHGVRSMQQLPLADPRSWGFPAAVHGIAGVRPPAGAPWNECQHASWYFLPWHRMYLYRFERILRSLIPAGDERDSWALP